jgi:hypothetical protein
MIDRQHGRIVIACDVCGRLSDATATSVWGVWLQAKREGWRTRKIGKYWRQFCGVVCASKLADDQISTGIKRRAVGPPSSKGKLSWAYFPVSAAPTRPLPRAKPLLSRYVKYLVPFGKA